MKQVYSNLIQPSVDLIETTNFFEVSMGKVTDEYGNLDEASSKYYTKAIAFQEKMNEKLATNQKEVMEYQAKYFSMFKSQGISLDNSYLMSESLTKAGYDIASLYNLSTEQAMEKIRAGIAGQVEPLRGIGIDISESALNKVIQNAGIERSVQELSYAEKEVARYIAIIEQAKQAQGDFAKTFESPANQIRIFKNQLEELKQVAGSFLVGVFGNILTYVNAIIMVLKEILKSFANLFGVELNYSGTLGVVKGELEDVEDSLGGAVKKAKEFKNQIMGFDEINNITLPTENSNGSGSLATGVDDRLLQSLKEWDNKMDSISGKAQEIRDKILEWLGFTEDVNGNLQWSWENMNKIAKIVSTIVGIIAGITLVGKIAKLVLNLKNLIAILKTGKGAVTSFQVGLSLINKVNSKVISGFKNLISGVKLGIEQFKLYRQAGDGVTTALGKTSEEMLTLVPNTVKVVGGIAGLVASTSLAYNSMKDLSNGTIGTTEAFLKLTSAIGGATASGALIGSVFGAAGIAIGAIAGFTISFTSSLIGYTTQITDSTKQVGESINLLNKKFEETKTKYDERVSSILESRDASILELETLKVLSGELQEIIDENGKVKEGYQERASTILNELNTALGTEYKLTGNQISINGELIKSYNDLKQSIDEYIEKQEKKIQAEAYEDIYKEQLKKRIELQEQLISYANKIYESESNLTEARKNLATSTGFLEKEQAKWNLKVEEGNLSNALQQQNELQEELNETNLKLQEAKKGFSDSYSSILNTAEETGNNIVMTTGHTFSSVRDSVLNYGQQTTDLYKNSAQESVKEYADEINNITTETEKTMYSIKGTIKSNTPEIVDTTRKTADEMLKSLKQIDTTEVGKQTVNGISVGINQNKNTLLNSIKSLKDFVVSKFKDLFQIHSPSKVMEDIAQYIPLGMAEGINKEANTVYDSIAKLSKGIQVNTQDLSINASEYVDYGQISGEISSKSNVNISGDIIQGISQAVSIAMQNANINVEVEAKTEEGVIVKKVSQGFKDYVTQTGELPFPIPV